MLAERSLAEEQMDDPALDVASYNAVLADLGRINSLTLARRPTLQFLARTLNTGLKRFRLLDVGYGEGDMLRAIARWAAKRGIEAELVGIDLNPRSEAAARAATPVDMPITYRTGDYADLASEPWDVIVSSLVAHHMTRDQLTAFLRFQTEHARIGWFVNDLHRHGFAWAGYPALAMLAGVHRIVRQDGQLSIARSYRPSEWPPLLAEAGVEGAQVERVFPFRLCVSWRRWER